MIRLRPVVRSAVLVAVCLVMSASLGAHHGTLVSYDRDKAWTAKAVVTDFRYVNPHAQIYFDVKDDKDHAGHWSGELLPNPAQLIAGGWTRKRSNEVLKAGTPVSEYEPGQWGPGNVDAQVMPPGGWANPRI